MSAFSASNCSMFPSAVWRVAHLVLGNELLSGQAEAQRSQSDPKLEIQREPTSFFQGLFFPCRERCRYASFCHPNRETTSDFRQQKLYGPLMNICDCGLSRARQLAGTFTSCKRVANFLHRLAQGPGLPKIFVSDNRP